VLSRKKEQNINAMEDVFQILPKCREKYRRNFAEFPSYAQLLMCLNERPSKASLV
jgi:hypothetical protein